MEDFFSCVCVKKVFFEQKNNKPKPNLIERNWRIGKKSETTRRRHISVKPFKFSMFCSVLRICFFPESSRTNFVSLFP
jgi:hypothetical protein